MTKTKTTQAPSVDVQPAYPPSTTGLSHTLLSADDEAALSARIETGLYAAHLLATGATAPGDAVDGATVEELEWLVADGEAARATFVQSNLRLALSTSRKFRNRGYTEEDVVQDAYHGLVRAVDRFDYKKGFKFSTYAVWWIRESILSGIRSSGFVKQPEVLFNHIVKVRATRLRLIDETGEVPTLPEIVAATGMTEREVCRSLTEDRPVTSLQRLLSEDLTLGEVLPDPDATRALDAVEESIDRGHLHRALTASLDMLSETDAAIVRARFGLDGHPPRQINDVAKLMGVTRQTVRTHEQRAMATLQHPSMLAALEPFRSTAR